jgi:NADH-quinone oxidoreductase subunit J
MISEPVPDVNVVQQVAFGIIAAAMCVSAVRVVTTRNVVHAALYLVVVLAGAAAIFVLLAAEFVAVVQVLVYIGAIVVLFLFGIMLTRAEIGRLSDLDNDQRWLAAIVAAFLFGVLGFFLYDTVGDVRVPERTVQTTGEVGDSIFATYVVPFEVISVLLLAALVGAVVIARKE